MRLCKQKGREDHRMRHRTFVWGIVFPFPLQIFVGIAFIVLTMLAVLAGVVISFVLWVLTSLHL
jgi:hypothetical protein